MRAGTYSRTNFASIFEQIFASLLLGLLAFTLLFGAALAGFQISHTGKIYPGVRVAGIALGGMTPDKAATRIAAQLNYPQTGRILVRDGTQTWLVAPGQIGLSINRDATLQRAYQYGRDGNIFNRLQEQVDTWYYGADVPPAFLFDQRQAYQFLDGIAQKVNKPVIEASVGLNGTDVTVRSGVVGRTVDIPATLEKLSTQLQTLQDGVVPLVIKETPPVILDASKAAETARSILSQPLTFTLPSDQTDQRGPWVIQPQTLAGMLSIERVNQNKNASYQVGVNTTLMRTYLGGLVQNVDIYPQNARFTFNDQTRQLEVIQKSVTGRTLDVEATLKSVQEKLAAGQHTIPLVFNLVKPKVEDTATGQQLGITELLHAETSYFYGSNAARVQNIQAAASKFHGLLVAPGETFSMANALGDISLDNGYAEAMIILGGKTIKGVGGGVCQVSTTLFRTVFFSGFPVNERHAHAYRVYYYEKVAGNRINPDLAGLDATVFVPLVDFKFTNDSPYWLLMETYVNPGSSSITWKFYSTSDGRKVDWQTTGPVNIVPAPQPEYHENPDLPQGEIKQVDWQADGADVTVNRTVSRNGGIYFQDTFNTHYEPWANVFEYGPGTDVPTPEPSPAP